MVRVGWIVHSLGDSGRRRPATTFLHGLGGSRALVLSSLVRGNRLSAAIMRLERE